MPDSRLAPTPSSDSCLRTISGAANLGLAIPPYSHELTSKDTVAARRASIDKSHFEVRASCLYPIIPPLLLDPVAAVLSESKPSEWVSVWKTAMHGAGYTDAQTSVQMYRQTILKGEDAGLGLFGSNQNPLACVVELSHQLQRSAVLLHYVTAVTLQYYLMLRSLFLRARTDRGAPFSEALPPYLLLMFRGQHWKIEQQQADALPAISTAEELDRLAAGSSFPLVLYAVMRWVQRSFPKAATLTGFGESKKDDVDSFCFEKLRKNFLQALMCMRFREVVPVNFEARVPGSSECIIKFFPHPKAATIRTLDVKATPPEVVDRCAQFYCHCFFSPYEPVFATQEVRVGASALWQLLLYYPLSDFDKTVVSAARLVFQTIPTAPGILHLNPVRARYTFYVHNDTAYALVPNLLLGEDDVPHDESNVKTISPMAWEWLQCNSPRLFSLSDWETSRFSLQPRPGFVAAAAAGLHYNPAVDSVHHLTQLECTYIRTQLSAEAAPTHAYWFFAMVKKLSGSEAVAAEATGRFFSLEQLQASYDEVRQWMLTTMRHFFSAEEIATMRASWDRCTDGSVRHGQLSPQQTIMLYLAWRILFPSATIGFGGQPWVAHWSRSEEVPSLMQAMSQVKAAFSRVSVLHELQQVAEIERTPEHIAALRVLEQMIKLCPGDMGGTMCSLLPKLQRAFSPSV